MKNILLFLFLVPLFGLSQSLSTDELKMVDEINTLRTNPKSYIQYVEEYISTQEWFLTLHKTAKVKAKSTTSNQNSNNDNTNGKTLSGTDVFLRNIEVAKGLIKILDTLKPLSKLTVRTDMYVITKTHMEYLTSVNKIGHYGPNGQTLGDRMKPLKLTVGENCASNEGIVKTIVLLLVDAGCDTFKEGYFGHREALLNPKYKFVSVAINNIYVVQNFAY